MDKQEERLRLYTGYVVAAEPAQNNPRVTLWKIKVQTPGEFFERRVSIEHGSVPRWIAAGIDVRFNLATFGKNATLVATDVEAYVRQTGNKEERTGR